jgi:RNA polymerase sigma factor (sigma-70 family)
MSAGQLTKAVHQIRRAAILHEGNARSDGELLGAFLARREATAFEALVRRHGPMVLGVCRRILRQAHDAEDAFQATFLVLVRKAASIVPRQGVGNWLYGVAYRTALDARRLRARRNAKEKQVADMPHPPFETDDVWHELRPVLDQELSRLPDKYRLPVILCDLEGRTRKQVASQLRLPEGTLSNRLAAARRMLARRLGRRGLTLSGGGLAALLSQNAIAGAVPPSLVGVTVKSAMLVAAGHAVVAGAISTPVAALTQGVLKAMLLTKLKTAMLILLAAGVVTVSTTNALPLHEAAKPIDRQKENPPSAPTQRTDQPKAAALFKKRTHDFGAVSGGRLLSWSASMSNPTNETFRISAVRVSDEAVTASARSVELTPNDQGTVSVKIDPSRFRGKKTFQVGVEFSEPRKEQILLELTATHDAAEKAAEPRPALDQRLQAIEKQLQQLLQEVQELRRDLETPKKDRGRTP